MTTLHLTTFVLASCCYFTYVIAFWTIFNKDQAPQRSFKMMLLKVSALLCKGGFLYILWNVRNPELEGLFTSSAFFIVSYFIFVWTAVTAKPGSLSLVFSSDKPKALISRGPYRYIRHPFYTAYILGYFAVFPTIPSIPVILAVGWMALIYYRAAREEESKFANSSLNRDYQEYIRSAGMFFPRIISRKAPASKSQT